VATLGSLGSNSSCLLYGALGNYQIRAYNPQYCNPNFDKAFCSTFLTNNTLACNTFRGAQLVCGGDKLDGFVISEPSCLLEANQYVMYYHSIGDYIDWIKEVSGATLATKVSIFTLLSGLLISLKNFI
jgi:hypothetical protein